MLVWHGICKEYNRAFFHNKQNKAQVIVLFNK